jgi:predicted ATPase/class 3 adenylate cyclase
MEASTPVGLPVGVVTLLFSDIEGSTRLLHELGDAYGEVLSDHHRLLRAVWLGHGGVEVGTEGDAFFVAFADPEQAVRAAVAAQRALAAHEWRDGFEVRVRMGVHTGSPRVRGQDYWGIDVHYAARLCAAAHGGQVLLSESTASLVDLEVEDLGRHAVKDFPSARRIFHLPVDGLGSDCFPPPRTLGTGRTNLPDQLSSFIGRERELAELHGLLGGARLVTLTGAGGVGKTRLALRLGAELLDGSSDGAWFVDLAPVLDSALVAATVAGVLGVSERAGQSVRQTLVERLAERELLVVLDNCEHVVESAAALAAAIIARCPGVLILATSREPLRIDGEQVYRVPSLSTPAEGIEDLGLVACSEGVRLFVERAAQQRPGFTLTGENASTIAQVCRRLDGIPLAIELAAVRLRSLSIVDLDVRLDQRFALLRGGSRTALPRQQTLLALIDWSYELLSDAERDVLARLSVFAANGFDLDAAQSVCTAGGIGRFEVLDHLDALVDKSLVQAEDVSGSVRYRLLETVRDYAARKLSERGDSQTAEARLAQRDHYLALAEIAHPHLLGPEPLGWFERLTTEHDNLRAALSVCLVDPDPEPGLRLAVALAEFWRARNHEEEGVRALRRQLERPDAQEPTLLRGYALAAGSRMLANAPADYLSALARGEEALEIARAERDSGLAAQALRTLAWVRLRLGEITQSVALSDEGIALARSLGDPLLLAQLNTARGAALGSLGRDARPALEEALALSRQIGNRSRIATALDNIGVLELAAGNLKAARLSIAEALQIFRELGDLHESIAVSVNLGLVCYLELDRENAARLFTDAVGAVRRGGDPEILALALLGLAFTRIETETAATLHGAADLVLEQLGFSLEPLESGLRESDHARLRKALGDDRFQSAYKTGHDLSRTEAVTLALGSEPA